MWKWHITCQYLSLSLSSNCINMHINGSSLLIALKLRFGIWNGRVGMICVKNVFNTHRTEHFYLKKKYVIAPFYLTISSFFFFQLRGYISWFPGGKKSEFWDKCHNNLFKYFFQCRKRASIETYQISWNKSSEQCLDMCDCDTRLLELLEK